MAHARLRLEITPGCVTAQLPPPRWSRPVRCGLHTLAMLGLGLAAAVLVWALPPLLSGPLFALLLLGGDLLLWSLADWLVDRLEQQRRTRRLVLRPGALAADRTLVPLAAVRAAWVDRCGVRLLPQGAGPVHVPSALREAEARQLQALLSEAIRHSRGAVGAVPEALRALVQSSPTARSRAA